MKNRIRFVGILLVSRQINAQDNNDCMSLDTCMGCLDAAAAGGDCKWTAGSCQPMCLMDAPCFGLFGEDDTPQSVCDAVDALQRDKDACTSQTDYDACVTTVLPSDESRTCQFFASNSGDGTGYCTDRCESYIGCEEFRPRPEEYVATEVSPGTDSSEPAAGTGDPCESQDTCSKCLSVTAADGGGDCKWTAGMCQSMCLMDAACFELRGEDETAESVCAAADAPKPIPEGAARIPEETGWISPDDAAAPVADIPEGAVPVPDVPPPPPLADIPEGAVPVPDVPPPPPLADIPEGAVPAVPEESASPDDPPASDGGAVPEVSRESPSGINNNRKKAMDNIRSGSTAGATEALLVEDEVENDHSGSAARTLIAAAAVLGLATVIMSVQ